MKKKKIILFILIILLVYAIGGITYLKLNKKPEVVKASNLDSIKGYEYSLKSNDTDLYKKEFSILKENLESKEINDEEYASSIAKLFIIDLYTINNKVNKYEVGGVRFVHPNYLANYKLNVQNTIYKYIEDNSYNNRKQELPEVSDVKITKTEKTNYKIDNNSYEGYKIVLEWTYTKDLGYENKGEVILIKLDKNYYVVEKN